MNRVPITLAQGFRTKTNPAEPVPPFGPGGNFNRRTIRPLPRLAAVRAAHVSDGLMFSDPFVKGLALVEIADHVQNAAVGLKTPEGVPLNVILRSTFVEQSGMGFDVGNCRNCEFSEDVFIYLGSASGAVRNRVGQSSSLLIRNSYFWFMTNSTALLLDAEPASAAPRHHGATIRESSFFGVKAAVVLNQVGGAKILHNDIFATGSGIEL